MHAKDLIKLFAIKSMADLPLSKRSKTFNPSNAIFRSDMHNVTIGSLIP